MITTFGLRRLGKLDRGVAVGRLADDADVRRPREREAKTFAHDLVVVDDQAGDLARHSDDRIPTEPDYTASASCSGSAGGSSRTCRRSRMPCSRASRATSARTGFVSGLRQVRAAVRVQLLVARQLLGPVAREVLEEVLARPGPEEEQVRPDAGRSGLARGAHDLRELLRPVGEPGEDRRHADARVDSGVDELADRAQTLARVRGRRLGLPPDVLVERRDRERDR